MKPQYLLEVAENLPYQDRFAYALYCLDSGSLVIVVGPKPTTVFDDGKRIEVVGNRPTLPELGRMAVSANDTLAKYTGIPKNDRFIQIKEVGCLVVSQ